MSSELGVERPTSLALSEAQGVERRVHFSEVERPRLMATSSRNSTSCIPSPRKPRPDPDFKPKRKRSMSFSSPGEHRFGNRWWYKRARVLPSKFLLGGSITDPLNLGSLDKEETLQTPTETSATGGGGGGASKRSAAVRVIIPPNINDPLNLDASSDNEDLHTDALQRQLRRRRRRKRKRRLSEPADGVAGHEREGGEALGLEAVRVGGASGSPSRPSQVTLKPLTINMDLVSPPGITEGRRESTGSQPVTPTGVRAGGGGSTVQRPPFRKQRHKSDNKIVSPVIPQPGGERKRHPSHSRNYAERPHLSQQNLQPPKSYNSKNELFQFGNYNKYYGYRNPDHMPDVRLEHLKREWFEGRDVLDIGCNIGHVALTVARDFNPKRVVGIDIDKKLVNIAQKNIKHYLRKGDAEEANFPKSMRLLYGPLRPPVQADGLRSFPHNIKFVHSNYVLESDELLETVRPEFDLVLCLSITKWIHLNWGDAGLKRFFRRIFYNLRPGGRLVLEPQAWPSYNKRRKLTKHIYDNYKSIRLFPDKFNDFLLHEVGFSTSEKLVTPNHTSRGFQRPIIIYTKAGSSSSSKSSPVGDGGTTTSATATTSAAVVMTDDDVFSSKAGEHSGEPLITRQEGREGMPEEGLGSGEGGAGTKEIHGSSSTSQATKHTDQQQCKDSCSFSQFSQPQTRVSNCSKTSLPSSSSSLSSSSSSSTTTTTTTKLEQEVPHVCDSIVNDKLVLGTPSSIDMKISKTTVTAAAAAAPSTTTAADAAPSTTTTAASSTTTTAAAAASSTTTTAAAAATATATTTAAPTPNISAATTITSVPSTTAHSPNTFSSPVSHGREDPLLTCPPLPSPAPPPLNCSKSIAVELNKETEEEREGSIDKDIAEKNLVVTSSISTSLNQLGGREGIHSQGKRKIPSCEEEEDEENNKRVRLGNT